MSIRGLRWAGLGLALLTLALDQATKFWALAALGGRNCMPCRMHGEAHDIIIVLIIDIIVICCSRF